ncbi:MAG: efflux RND transporter periplasmic adaptor subunit [Cellvibrionaceae bacterium]|nr:efflux RND transporter periplasmic adaptor subunit [Cellvibrionaceae bacterium]
MEIIKKFFLFSLLLFGFNQSWAMQDDPAHEQPKGPNGGTLLKSGQAALEITLFEDGVPPEMRVFAYREQKPLDPAQLTLKVQLKRLGGKVDNLTFQAEGGYLRSEQVVLEPHSYDVSVMATFAGETHQWQYQSHEGRSHIPPRILAASGIKTEVAGPQTLAISRQLFGVIEAPIEKQAGIFVPYPSTVEKIHVSIGQKVKRGQAIATLRNIKTLQRYTIKSPIAGEVTEWIASIGQRVDAEPLARVMDLSQVWVEMSAFPEDIEQLAPGQKVIAADMHQHLKAEGKIIYIAPQMTGGHIARARALIDNSDGHWRPGMHVKAKVITEQRSVALAVKTEALQNYREMDVVFGKFGDTFEVRMLELGANDGDYVEVLAGLEAGTEYATVNSFIIKADVLKDGASHDH